MKKKWIALWVLITFLFCLAAPVYAEPQGSANQQAVKSYIDEIGQILMKNNPQPKPGSIGGEWLILGLARSDLDVSKTYYDAYYTALESVVKEKQGVLHKRKYTEYSRTILALTAMGKDPTNVAGYNLLQPLNDYKATVQQGINGAIFALLALDSNDYSSDVRRQYVQYILEKELPDGGWAMNGSKADIDVTAMALQALAPYCDAERAKAESIEIQKIEAAVVRGLNVLSSCEIVYCESAAQSLVAMTTLGVDSSAIDSALECMMTFYQQKKGFAHTINGEANNMASEQAFYALVAVERYQDGSHTLYDMTPEEADITLDNYKAEQKEPTLLQSFIQTVSNLWRKGA